MVFFWDFLCKKAAENEKNVSVFNLYKNQQFHKIKVDDCSCVCVRSPFFNTITQNSLLKVALNTIILQYSLLYIDMNEILSKIGIIKELFITGQKSQETEN